MDSKFPHIQFALSRVFPLSLPCREICICALWCILVYAVRRVWWVRRAAFGVRVCVCGLAYVIVAFLILIPTPCSWACPRRPMPPTQLQLQCSLYFPDICFSPFIISLGACDARIPPLVSNPLECKTPFFETHVIEPAHASWSMPLPRITHPPPAGFRCFRILLEFLPPISAVFCYLACFGVVKPPTS